MANTLGLVSSWSKCVSHIIGVWIADLHQVILMMLPVVAAHLSFALWNL